MDCANVRETLVELQDGPVDPSIRRAVDAHLPACAECRRFQAALARVDAGLSRHLRAPALDLSFRERLDARLAKERRRVWADWLPAVVHFASCGVATAVCVALLPEQAGLVAAAAAGITVVSHFLLTTAQTVLDTAGD
jgi:predicted anti-sigma-YlaC factor YlaD